VPIYEYRCSSCGHQQEYIQKISDPVLTVCPACSRATYGKMLTAAGFQLKGSGWYATDFRNSGAKAPAKKDEAPAAAKSDAKPDATSETKSGDSGPAKSCGAACACS